MQEIIYRKLHDRGWQSIIQQCFKAKDVTDFSPTHPPYSVRTEESVMRKKEFLSKSPKGKREQSYCGLSHFVGGLEQKHQTAYSMSPNEVYFQNISTRSWWRILTHIRRLQLFCFCNVCTELAQILLVVLQHMSWTVINEHKLCTHHRVAFILPTVTLVSHLTPHTLAASTHFSSLSIVGPWRSWPPGHSI